MNKTWEAYVRILLGRDAFMFTFKGSSIRLLLEIALGCLPHSGLERKLDCLSSEEVPRQS